MDAERRRFLVAAAVAVLLVGLGVAIALPSVQGCAMHIPGSYQPSQTWMPGSGYTAPVTLYNCVDHRVWLRILVAGAGLVGALLIASRAGLATHD